MKLIDLLKSLWTMIKAWFLDLLSPTPVDPPTPPPTDLPDEPPPDLPPGHDYPDPIHADRTTGIRQIRFIDDFKTHVGAKSRHTGEFKYNEAGALIIVQDGRKFPKDEAVWCWFKKVDVDPGNNAYEVCGIPGNLVIARDSKVLWKKEDVLYQLPE